MATWSYVERLRGAGGPVWDRNGHRTGVGADIYKQVEGVVHGEGVQIYIPEGGRWPSTPTWPSASPIGQLAIVVAQKPVPPPASTPTAGRLPLPPEGPGG